MKMLLLLAVLSLSAPQSAPERFGLACKGQMSGTTGTKDFEIELRIDLGAKSWCYNECKNVYPIVGLTADRITLDAIVNPTMTFNRWVDRKTNKFHDTTKAALLVSGHDALCQRTPFKGFSN